MATSRRARIPVHYLGVWALLMTLAVAYIVTATIRPEWLDDVAPPFRLSSVLLQEDEQAIRAAAEETDALQKQLLAARAELNSIRGELARRTDRETTLALKLAAIEAREAKLREEQAIAPMLANAQVTEPAAPRIAEKPRAAKAPPPAAPPATAAAAAPGQQVASAPVRPAPPRPPARTAAAGAPLETSSVPAAPKAEAAAVAIQLSAGPSVDALRLNWMLLSQRHQALLQKMQPRYMASREPNPNGPAFDLIAGPVPNAAEAQRVCDALRAQNVTCKVSTFTGNAL